MPRKDILAQAAEALVPLMRSVATDPRRLKPGELIRLLNSTPLGQVLDDRRLRSHRARAGMRIGEGKSIDLFRYAAWLASERHNPPGGSRAGSRANPAFPQGTTLDFADAYAAKKERDRGRQAAISKTGRDIGPIPEVSDPALRGKCVQSLRLFLETCFPETFPEPWSDDHLDLIKECERIIKSGGKKAFAFPRGSGKTSIIERAAIWAVLCGYRGFVVCVGATKRDSDKMLESIKGELEANDLLAALFPEVCFPIHKLEGINNRCRGQLCQGEPTWLKWSGAVLVLPTIAGSQASGAVIAVRSITGAIRGLKHRRAEGQTIRPDFVILDDVQTDKVAHNPQQVTKLKRTITGAVLGLAGPGKSISVFFPCTIIQPDDLAAQFLDHKLHPEWRGQKTRLVYAWPKSEKLWDQYAEIRRQSFDNGGNGEEATDFYRKNKKSMDVGAKVAWPSRKLPEELSAIQHAVNLRLDSPETFDAEYQNDPVDPRGEETEFLSLEQICAKTSGLAVGVVPLECTRLTAFIDVQHSLLYWLVCAWTDDFSGSVIDYGTWPDQQRRYFTFRDAKRTLARELKGMSKQAAVEEGIRRLADQLRQREWKREGIDGTVLRIEKILIDSKDGQTTENVMRVCRNPEYSAILLPSAGRGIGPNEKPIGSWKPKPGERIGDHWIANRSNKWGLVVVTIDTNYWKTFFHLRLAAPRGDKGSLLLYGKKGTDHRMLAEQCKAEERDRIRSEKSGRTVDVWKLPPGRDNHLFDCAVGASVAASVQGCNLTAPRPKAKPAHTTAAPDRPRVRPLNL